MSKKEIKDKSNIKLIELLQNLEKKFTNKMIFLSELMLNAKRTNSSKIIFTFDEQNKILEISDDGVGIEMMENILDIGQYECDIAEIEKINPFSIGFISAIISCSHIKIVSKSGRIEEKTDEILSLKPIKLFPKENNFLGTKITMSGIKLDGKVIERELKHLASGFPIDVIYNDVPFQRPNCIDENFKDTEIGLIKFHGLNSGDDYKSYGPKKIENYLDGLPIGGHFYEKYKNYYSHIVHLDLKFTSYLPDRKKLINEKKVIEKVDEVIKKHILEYFNDLKNNLPGELFANYYEVLLDFDLIYLLNDVNYIPKKCIKKINKYPNIYSYNSNDDCFENEHTFLSKIEDNLSKEDIIKYGGITKFITPTVLNLQHYIFAYKKKLLLYVGKLHKDHWLFSLLINIDKLEVILINETTSQSYELWTGFLTCHLASCGIDTKDYIDEFVNIRFCDSYKIIVNEDCIDINDQACAYVHPSEYFFNSDYLFDDESIQIEIIMPKYENKANVLLQLSDFEGEYGQFDEVDYMENCEQLKKFVFTNRVNNFTNPLDKIMNAIPKDFFIKNKLHSIFNENFLLKIDKKGACQFSNLSKTQTAILISEALLRDSDHLLIFKLAECIANLLINKNIEQHESLITKAEKIMISALGKDPNYKKLIKSHIIDNYHSIEPIEFKDNVNESLAFNLIEWANFNGVFECFNEACNGNLTRSNDPENIDILLSITDLDLWFDWSSSSGIMELYKDFKIHPGIGILKNLECLSINFSDGIPKILTIPYNLEKLVNLSILKINNHQCDFGCDRFLLRLPKSISKLGNLNELELNHLEIEGRDEIFKNITALKILTLQSVSSDNFDIYFSACNPFPLSLIELDLSFNDLSYLPDFLGELKLLEKLNISFNNFFALDDFYLDYIFEVLESLDKLESLDFSANYSVDDRLISLPKSIVAIKNLKNINLDCSDISYLPSNFGSLKYLEELKLPFHLKRLPKSFSKLNKLKKLDLNHIKNVPEWIDLICSSDLDLEINISKSTSAKYFTNLMSIKELKSLKLSFDFKIPDNFYINTEELILYKFFGDVDMNDLNFIQNFIFLKKLTISYSKLDGNLMSEFLSKLSGLPNLKILQFEGCENVTFLTETLSDLHRLKEINLCGCKNLESLPNSLSKLPTLEKLDLRFTKIKALPECLLHLKDITIFDY
jgi:Leucine-rich repeat (LRR) protein